MRSSGSHVMTGKLTPTEQLARLRKIVMSLEAGTKIFRDGLDVTKDDLRVLKAEIAFLERTFFPPSEE
jgi:hypothetical protein